MSFIPHRDVFNLSDDEAEKIGNLYDEIERQFEEDYVRDEYGSDWTPERVYQETGRYPCPTLSGYNMLVYMYARMRAIEERSNFE
jgi:hypothetical protein